MYTKKSKVKNSVTIFLNYFFGCRAITFASMELYGAGILKTFEIKNFFI